MFWSIIEDIGTIIRPPSYRQTHTYMCIVSLYIHTPQQVYMIPKYIQYLSLRSVYH